MIRRHPLNAPGDWYIDTNCINCTAAATVAPGLIVERGGQSAFARQPETDQELSMAWRARLLCPTASVRTERHERPVTNVFPEELAPRIYRLGYNASSSYGAHAYLIRRATGNVMIDSPRWTKHVIATIEAWGGLSHILLTHRDDVADADRYADRFDAQVWIHEADRNAAPYANRILSGPDPQAITADILAIPVPGHSPGSVVYLHEGNSLFTGDSLAWSFQDDDLMVFENFCWSLDQHTQSLRRLLDYPFTAVFAGHGGSRRLSFGEMHTRLAALVARMVSDTR